ncbi:UbiX family flavin prenyltransferase [Ensifer adhaerens]|jgi:flavin prenyltransferase|uniref:Flavin prenyltransferase UbiX n=1 Tax=Ensifer adhaerens TaxID=106592 RepID=A0ABY8HT50_ENSAD|nr:MULTISPECIES: UbiX family flavin prenyltransferase [Ensifer]ANK76870.1 aromatic acid decarboxylase [Ensifer adhaerens]KDP75450.1 aromatic acid decarboxylase [Ensifer adhaerens]KQZ52874.1 aromatic acid decarboxylase [Ensifer sp. Root558]MBD9544175.1 UbiX family flavin prenyltransferase [Ensifer sp. ENS04]MBD9572383.1 UbiX family flavin prenyltransferase [Ensifer sp. ENS08]
MTHPRRMIVGISGASGVVYGKRILELLRDLEIETHLIMSRAACITLAAEATFSRQDLEALATTTHSNKDIGAVCSSGSYKTLGMIVAPCSVKTLAEIATGTTDNLISRAADVVLKERRRLVLMLRETPLHLGHIRNMAHVTEMGGIIYPPVPAFYAKPQSIEDMVDHTVGRVLDLFDLDPGIVRRWRGTQGVE